MKKTMILLFAALTIAACSGGGDKKPLLDQQRQLLDKAKKINGIQQQETQKQKQGIDQQTQ